MARRRRIAPDGSINHVLNRGNRRARIFHKPADYAAFFNILCDAQDDVPMRILAVCVMPNHFHLVLWPLKGSDLSAYMHRVETAHVRRYHKHYELVGTGHLYQGRFKNFIVQDDGHLYNVLRYVEGNAHRANLVRTAEEWKWSSLRRRFAPNGRTYLSDWPVPRPEDWVEQVNLGFTSDELAKLRVSARRGRPYGEERWVRDTAQRFGLEWTLRDRGGQRKGPNP